MVAGRRAGKSRIFALIAVYLATFRDWSSCLAPGERGYVLIIAAERQQTEAILNFIRALLKETPLLAPLIAFEGVDEIALTNGIAFSVATRSHRAVRSKTVIARSSTRSGSGRTARRAAILTPRSSRLCCRRWRRCRDRSFSRPVAPLAAAASCGAAYERHFGKPGPVLVWHAPSRVMNPLLPASEIERAYAADPARAARNMTHSFATAPPI